MVSGVQRWLHEALHSYVRAAPVDSVGAALQFRRPGRRAGAAPTRQSYNMPFVLGPSVDIRVLPSLSLETGVLYHRIGRSTDNFVSFYPENAVTLGFETSHGSALELPLLAKFRFKSERSAWRPFLTAGPTVRRTSITTDSSRSTSILSGSSLSAIGTSLFAARTTTQWNVDPTVGAGASFRTGRFHIEPEVRYSYWGAGTTGPVRKNQVNFLLGFRL